MNRDELVRRVADGEISFVTGRRLWYELGYEQTQFPLVNTQARDYWQRVARVALRRFPELQRGESIGVREIKRRLGEMRRTGYEVKPYSSLRKEEAWEYLMQLRGEISRRINSMPNPEYRQILADIQQENLQRKEDARI